MSNNPTPPRIEREAGNYYGRITIPEHRVMLKTGYCAGATKEHVRAAPVVKALERLFRLHREFLDADEVKEIEQLIKTYKEDVIDTDIDFVKSVLPDHYAVKESKITGSIHCKSITGIPDDPPFVYNPTGEIVGDYKEDPWKRVFNAIKEHFGDRFQEIFHNTCTNHVDFTIYLKH